VDVFLLVVGAGVFLWAASVILGWVIGLGLILAEVVRRAPGLFFLIVLYGVLGAALVIAFANDLAVFVALDAGIMLGLGIVLFVLRTPRR